jgi:hypothetical protein
MKKQNPQSARRNNFPGEQIARRFLFLLENLSASNYPGAAKTLLQLGVRDSYFGAPPTFQRLVPRDAHPAGVCIALESGTLHGVLQAVRRIDNLGSGSALDADTPLGMRGVSGDLPEETILDRRHDAASRHAHGTVGLDVLGSHGRLSFSCGGRLGHQQAEASCSTALAERNGTTQVQWMSQDDRWSARHIRSTPLAGLSGAVRNFLCYDTSVGGRTGQSLDKVVKNF